jgi:DNA-binding MarR family transcriptional regulator
MAQRQDAVKLPEGFVERSPAGDALTEFVLHVVRLSMLFGAKGEALARPSGQTLARWVALNAAAEAPASVAEISRRFGFARQSVQRVADLLVADGLAVYQDNPRHQRAKLLVPTHRGREVILAINTRQKAWADALGARIGEAELERASATMDGIARALRDERSSDEASSPEPSQRRGPRSR